MNANNLGSAGGQPAVSGSLPETLASCSGCSPRISARQAAAPGRLAACAPQILAITLFLTLNAGAATLQERIDAATPNETIRVESGVHGGAIKINKPLTLVGEPGAEIRGNGSGKVVTVAANDVTLRGLRISGSGLRLSDDDAAIFVTGNHAIIENCVIADSLHGIYLKKISGAQILNNRIQGKTTLAASTEAVEKGIGESAENCDTTLVTNRRGNGIHQWNCEGNLIRGNEISDTRDGIYFSFTNNSRVENNLIQHARYGLHYSIRTQILLKTIHSPKMRLAPRSCFQKAWWCAAIGS